MKMDQIAFCCNSKEQELAIKLHFNLQDKDWIHDIVTALSYHYSPGGMILSAGYNVAELMFNYDLGIELEILRYLGGENFLSDFSEEKPFISHVGIHLDDNEAMPESDDYMKCVQETFTVSHTSSYLTDKDSKGYGRRYQYRIFSFGYNNHIKYIRRVHPGNNDIAICHDRLLQQYLNDDALKYDQSRPVGKHT